MLSSTSNTMMMMMMIAALLITAGGKLTDASSSKGNYRLLRGGSYSRGGSSSSSWSSGGSSGSYYNNNNSNYYNRNNGGGGGFGVFFLVIMGLLFLACVAPGLCMTAVACLPCLGALCCGAGLGAAAAGAKQDDDDKFRYQNHNNMNCSNNPTFEQAVQRAKDEVERSSTIMLPYQPQQQQPYSGQYTTSFIDPESKISHNAALCLFFTPNGNNTGYRIGGQGSDIDGNTIVEDGFATLDGNAWWRERSITGDVGLHVLSRGTFHYPSKTFQGTWLASSMVSGPYVSFTAAAMQQDQPTTAMNNATSHPSSSSIPFVAAQVLQPTTKETMHYSPDVPFVQGEVIE